MTQTVYILSGYNNYYNRIVKKENSLEDYQPYVSYTLTETNFVPNDNVNTEHVVGTYDYDGTGDYVVVVDSNNEIVSRWFIIESVRTRAGQYKLTLHRDLIVDHYDEVVNAPMFVEKATLPSDSPLVFNSEQMTFNQIKTSETLIKDKSNCPWIVGYYAKNAETNFLSGTVDRNILDDVYDISIDTPFENWEFNATIDPFYLQPQSVLYRIYGMSATTSVGFQKQQGYLKISKEGEYLSWSYVKDLSASLNFNFKADIIGQQLAQVIKDSKESIYTQAKTYLQPTSQEDSEYFLNLNGKIVKDSDGKFYTLAITPDKTETVVVDVGAGDLFNTLKSICAENSNLSGTPNTQSFKIEATVPTYKMTAVELEGAETTWDMSGSKIITEDAPYNIFAIPYGTVTLKLNGQSIVTSNENDSIAAANSIIKTMGDNLYDIQLLPYCPLVLDEDAIINVLSDLSYSLVTAPGTTEADPRINIGFILNIPSSRFSKNIYLDEPITINNVKIENECDMYKLCSPNWASEFQFSAAKNGGVQYFNIDCEYKPFSPYIHVNPNFGGLYGQDWNDARGLILSGDFSLAQIKSQWQQYQMQNKNFQNIFDRQIQNMEVQHKAQRIQDIAGGIAGVSSGAAGGALLGSMVPGIGTAVGAMVGGALSIGGGVADYAINEMLRNEAIDYTKDLFGYQLGNIQALPYTLTKVSSFNNNNKIFPVLEYYTCTDTEKEALAHKIAYNGMSVGVIGTMNQFIQNSWSYNGIESKGYIKGQLIRLETIDDDYHIVNAIAGELNKGVYIQ